MTMTEPTLSPEPAPHTPDRARVRSSAPGAAAGIGSNDWDLLFRAALDTLAGVAREKTAPMGTGPQLQAPGTVLRECLQALDQLRCCVPHADRGDDAGKDDAG